MMESHIIYNERGSMWSIDITNKVGKDTVGFSPGDIDNAWRPDGLIRL